MSLDLERSGGISARTHHGWAATEAGPFHALWLMGGDKHVEVPMSVATKAIEKVVDDPTRSDDPVMSGLRQYMRSLHVEEQEYSPCDNKSERFMPDSLGERALRGALTAAETRDEPLEFLQNKIAEADFVYLVHYVMTNTPLWLEMPTDTEDPRVTMIQTFRNGN